MKIIFFGSSDFAATILKSLKDKEEVILTVTQPDRKKGRSLKVCATPVKAMADRLGIKTVQPEDVNRKDLIDYLKSLNAELFVVAGLGKILKRELLDAPSRFSINVHASLLPKYRGAAPINRAIANGEEETGVAIINMNERMDEGDIILDRVVRIDNEDNAVTLSKKLFIEAALLLLRSIELIKEGRVNFVRQDNAKATYAPKLKKTDGLIDWQQDAEDIYNRVRAFVPWPACFTYWDKKILKIWKAKTTATVPGTVPGTVVKVGADGIVVSAGKGALRIEELQLEGKRSMSAEEFTRGHKEMRPGVIFSRQ